MKYRRIEISTPDVIADYLSVSEYVKFKEHEKKLAEAAGSLCGFLEGRRPDKMKRLWPIPEYHWGNKK